MASALLAVPASAQKVPDCIHVSTTSSASLTKLQQAGRAAKGAGLDLNIDKGTEKNLLEHDFDSDMETKPEARADPGNL